MNVVNYSQVIDSTHGAIKQNEGSKIGHQISKKFLSAYLSIKLKYTSKDDK